MSDAPAEIQAVRTSRVRRASLTNVALQAVQVATGLISVPLTFRYLGEERFGLWMTLTTALAFIAFADFGIGIGTQDRMVRSLAEDHRDAAKSYFFSTFSFVALLVTVVVAIAAFAVPHLGIVGLFSIRSPVARAEVVATTFMAAFVFGVGLLAGIVQRAYNALQEAHLAATILLIGRVLSLALLIVALQFEPGLPLLVFIIGGVPPTLLVVVGLLLLFRRHPWMLSGNSSSSSLINFGRLRAVLRVGVLGLGAAIAIYLINNSSLVIMSVKYSAAEASDFALVVKMLGIPAMFIVYVLQPLWPAIADANARKDYRWIEIAYAKAARQSAVFALMTAIGVLLFGRQAIELWVGRSDVAPSYQLLLTSVAFFVVGCWNTLLTTLLNGVSAFRSQAIGGIVIAVVFALIAYALPQSLDKAAVVGVVATGFLVRCLVLQLEVNRLLKTWSAETV